MISLPPWFRRLAILRPRWDRWRAGSEAIAKFLAGLAFAGALAAQAPTDWRAFTLRDPARVVTAEACGECHALEHGVWKETPHASGFYTLHRKQNAAAIAERMGVRLIKRDSLCLKCHYTAEEDAAELRAVSGVSCESCHGAARDWIGVHNRYGEGYTRQTEPAAHREERIRRSREAGMRRPSEIYDVARSCFECHTVPEERLVDVGGHSTGSTNFELVARSQGDIRHNFLAAQTGGGSENRESSPERRRRLYLAGRTVDLEYSLRGMARASQDGVYARAMTRRVRNALAEVQALAESGAVPEAATMIERVRSVRVVVGNGPALLAAAEAVGELTRTALERHPGETLAALDPLLRGEGGARAPVEESVLAATAEPAPGAAVSAGTPGVTGTTVTASAANASKPTTPGVVGERRSRLRPASRYATVGPGACSGCHAPQNAWWFGDRHFTSAEPFYAAGRDQQRVARLYGVAPASMTRGDTLCMDCHGTVVTGQAHREVLDGVGCESCHGAAGEWLEPHKQEGGAARGRQRPGFQRALALGKNDLEDLAVRARVCASCHWVTDPRLVSSGHPTGRAYDFVAAVGRIRHWSQPLEDAAELRAAWAAATSERGPIPAVAVATLADQPGVPDAAASPASADAAVAPRLRRLRPPPPRPVGDRGSATVEDSALAAALPPFPEIDATTPVEEALQVLLERIELLYGLVHGESGGAAP